MKNPLDLWRNPFVPSRDWNQLQTMMDRMLEEYSWPKNRLANKEFAFNPSCEVTEDKNHYLLKFDLPGLSKEQVKIEIHDNQLAVSGERKEEKKEEGKKQHMTEISYGSFLRTFTLPTNIDPEKVEAKFDNGVLSIAIAKGNTASARQVTIK